MSELKVQLLLARHAETAWQAVIRPWLEESRETLVRSYVVVPTRGQSHGLKQRCVLENLPLLGVEFLSPGLARQKWLPLTGSAPVLGRELLLFELRVAVTARLSAMADDDVRRGLLKSLLSDAERALDDFDALLKSGRSAKDFAEPLLREIFSEVEARVDELGYVLGAAQSRLAALRGAEEVGKFQNSRLLICGFGAEAWGEFFNVAAFARCFADVLVVLPEPEFSGRRTLDEDWVGLWERFLGVEPLPVDAEASEASCEHVATWWGGAGETGLDAVEGVMPGILVGRTRSDEMRLVADRVVRLLSEGAAEIAVVFPAAGAATGRLARLLEQRGVPFVNLLPRVAAAPLEARLQRALLAFYARGGRLDELLALWPLLLAAGQTELPLVEARGVCERLFDERLTHSLSACLERLAAASRPEWKEVARVAALLLPVWPAEIGLSAALERFDAVCAGFDLEMPPGWAALRSFAERETRMLPANEVVALMDSFVPKDSMATGSAGSAGFARVVLTTRRRAEGLAWSHVIFTGSNAGVWPQRQSPTGWLTDEQKRKLNEGDSRLPLLPTSDDSAWLERRSYAALARDARDRVIFSAALSDEEQPEMPLAPNAWLERVLWHNGVKGGAIAEAFERLAAGDGVEEKAATAQAAWHSVWLGRRDPARGFDDWFFSVDPVKIRPERLAARTIEASVADPAVLWYEAVLGCPRLAHGPLLRSGPRALGLLIHRVVAKALRGEQREGVFFPRPEKALVARRLMEELQLLRAGWPADRYWDSFHAMLAHRCTALVERVMEMESVGVMATELGLPPVATVALEDGLVLPVSGRMDLVLADREDWMGASVEIVDFKTGSDKPLSARRMASHGASLQLGVYLAAARSLGVTSGRVWLMKPDEASSLAMSDLDPGLAKLKSIARHLATGRYGARTPDATKYGAEAQRPLACTPIPALILAKKYEVTFGEEGEGAADE